MYACSDTAGHWRLAIFIADEGALSIEEDGKPQELLGVFWIDSQESVVRVCVSFYYRQSLGSAPFTRIWRPFETTINTSRERASWLCLRSNSGAPRHSNDIHLRQHQSTWRLAKALKVRECVYGRTFQKLAVLHTALMHDLAI